MCLILDANMYGDFSAKGQVTKPIRHWIEKKGGRIVYSETQTFETELN